MAARYANPRRRRHYNPLPQFGMAGRDDKPPAQQDLMAGFLGPERASTWIAGFFHAIASECVSKWVKQPFENMFWLGFPDIMNSDIAQAGKPAQHPELIPGKWVPRHMVYHRFVVFTRHEARRKSLVQIQQAGTKIGRIGSG